jgi:hypothetical protein
MKTVKWIREGEPVPDGAKYLGENRKIVTRWDSDHDLLPSYAAEWHTIYLYEIPVPKEALREISSILGEEM